MDKTELAWQIIERAFFSVHTALQKDENEEIFYEDLPEDTQMHLMELQKLVCDEMDVDLSEKSMVGGNETFIYSAEPFLA